MVLGGYRSFHVLVLAGSAYVEKVGWTDMPVKSTRPTFSTIVVYRSDVLILVAHYNIAVLALKFLVQTFSFLRARRSYLSED